MANLRNFRIDTEFTAPKQLPQAYYGKLNVSAQSLPADTIGRVLGEIDIAIPAGSFSDLVLLHDSLNNTYSPIHYNSYEVAFDSSTYMGAYIFFNLRRRSATAYRLQAIGSNLTASTRSFPSFSVEAWVRLLEAPFS